MTIDDILFHPSFRPGMTSEEYHASTEALSSSMLKKGIAALGRQLEHGSKKAGPAADAGSLFEAVLFGAEATRGDFMETWKHPVLGDHTRWVKNPPRGTKEQREVFEEVMGSLGYNCLGYQPGPDPRSTKGAKLADSSVYGRAISDAVGLRSRTGVDSSNDLVTEVLLGRLLENESWVAHHASQFATFDRSQVRAQRDILHLDEMAGTLWTWDVKYTETASSDAWVLARSKKFGWIESLWFYGMVMDASKALAGMDLKQRFGLACVDTADGQIYYYKIDQGFAPWLLARGRMLGRWNKLKPHWQSKDFRLSEAERTTTL